MLGDRELQWKADLAAEPTFQAHRLMSRLAGIQTYALIYKQQVTGLEYALNQPRWNIEVGTETVYVMGADATLQSVQEHAEGLVRGIAAAMALGAVVHRYAIPRFPRWAK